MIPICLIRLILSFHDSYKVQEKRKKLNRQFQSYFYEDFLEDGIFRHFYGLNEFETVFSNTI